MGMLPHAVLIEGNSPDIRMGKAMGLLKDHFKADPIAAGKLDNGTFEDLIVIDPDDGKDITVGLIEDLINLFKQKPFASTSKACLIPHGERMNESAQNKLLKLLEEPAAGDVILILTDNAWRLLPTVRSRCMRIWLGYPAHEAGALTEDIRMLAAALVYRRGAFPEAVNLFSRYEGSREEAIEFLAAFQLFLRNLLVVRLSSELTGYAKGDEVWIKDSVSKINQNQAGIMQRGVMLAEKAQKNIERGDRIRYVFREMALSLRSGEAL